MVVSMSALVLIGFNVTATNIAFVEIEDTFSGTSRATLSWSVSGFSIALASFMLIWGRLADRVGRRRVFRAGLVVMAAASLATALAPTVGVFIAARLAQGFGGAMIVPASLALILPEFPKSRHATIVGIWSAAGPLGAAVSPSLSALVLNIASWRWVYLLGAPIALAALIGGWNVLREAAPDDEPTRLDIEGVLIGTMSIALFTLGIVQGPSWGWTSVAVVGCLVAAALLMPAFILRSRRHPAPLLDVAIFKVRTVWVATVTNGLLAAGGFSMWLVWPLFLQDIWDYTAFETALAITPGPIVAAPIAIVAGRTADRRGYHGMVMAGSIMPVIAVVFLAVRLDATPDYWTEFFPGIVLFGAGFGLTFSPLNAAALRGVRASALAQVHAAFNTINNAAGAVGIAVAVALLGESGRSDALAAFDRAFLALGLFALAAAVIFRVFYPSAEARKSAVATAEDSLPS